MHSSNKIYSVREYKGILCEKDVPGFTSLPKKTFDDLEIFVLENTKSFESNPNDFFMLRSSVHGKVISPRNYVGVITMKDGTVIEILPKIVGESIGETETKQIFLDMLRVLNVITFKACESAKLQTERLNLFEIFIKMLVDELVTLTKQGLKSAYSGVEANERFYKGKLQTSSHIKNNWYRVDRFFIRYDEFSLNRPENRLIKSTLLLLLQVTKSSQNRSSITRLLTFFEYVPASESIETDFSKCATSRDMNHYVVALSWCRVFLMGESFTAFSGSSLAYALLFPMEQLFERYIYSKLAFMAGKEFDIRAQEQRFSLFDLPAKSFSLRPDIVINKNGKTVVIDTKWKLVNTASRNNGISQSDMYQVYAYAKKYEAEKVYLLYPRSDLKMQNNLSYLSNDNVNVRVAFIDLLDPNLTLQKILNDF